MSFLESLASSGAWYSGFIADFIKCFITKDRYLLILEGIGVTVKVSLLAILLGILIGLIVAMLNLSKTKILQLRGLAPKKTSYKPQKTDLNNLQYAGIAMQRKDSLTN